VHFDRACADVELSADLLICSSVGQKLENFLLPTTQRVDRQCANGLFPVNHRLLGKQTTPEETMLNIWLIFSTGRSLVKMPFTFCRM
jgi:hypothetical protein